MDTDEYVVPTHHEFVWNSPNIMEAITKDRYENSSAWMESVNRPGLRIVLPLRVSVADGALGEVRGVLVLGGEAACLTARLACCLARRRALNPGVNPPSVAVITVSVVLA